MTRAVTLTFVLFISASVFNLLLINKVVITNDYCMNFLKLEVPF